MKRKVREPRRVWEIKPITRIKESEKTYNRNREKEKLRKED